MTRFGQNTAATNRSPETNSDSLAYKIGKRRRIHLPHGRRAMQLDCNHADPNFRGNFLIKEDLNNPFSALDF
jgi:hypothetical protein